MKKTLSILLSLMLVCTAAFALAEAAEPIEIEITFDGEYIPFEELGFEILIPSDWVIFQDDEEAYMVGSEDQSQLMLMTIAELNGATAEDLLASIQEDEMVESVSEVTINGVAFLVYTSSEGFFGATTFLENDTHALNFIFVPADDDFIALAEQILASIQTL